MSDIKEGSAIASWEVKEGIARLHVRKGPSQMAFVEVYLYGAHVTRWEEAGQKPLLFLSEKAVLDGSKAIRGGIPLVFPQFGGMGPLPAHGFARTSKWTVVENKSSPKSATADSVSLTLALVSNEATQKAWNHSFNSSFTVTLSGAANSRLKCDWHVKNTDDDNKNPFTFTSALHTYFNVADSSSVAISNLKDVQYMDQLDKNKIKTSGEVLRFSAEHDSVYLNAPNSILITDPVYARTITASKTNFADAVIWNPWIAKSKAMADFGDEEYKIMVCVEAAVIAKPIQLKSGESWSAGIELSHAPIAPNVKSDSRL